jgi:dTMP kinase
MAAFISLEGIDGSGKTTQLRLLERYLQSLGLEVVVAREPGGTEVGDTIRQLLLNSKTSHLRPLSELLLYYVSRNQNLYENILPALEAECWVLCDRYADASVAYQGYGRGVELDVIEYLSRITIDRHLPDLTLLIDIDPEVGLARARERNRQDTVDEGRFEKESLEFYNRVRQGYLKMAQSAPQRIRVINGGQPIEVVHQQILGIVSSLIQAQSDTK